MELDKRSLRRLSKTVDDLGAIRSMIAELTSREAKLKQVLIDSGLPEIDGGVFRATVSHHQRSFLDSGLVKLILSAEQIKFCTKASDVTTVKVTSRIRVSKVIQCRVK